MIRLLLTREDRHQDYLSARSLGPNPSEDRANTFGDFGGGVAPCIGGITRIVRANMKHDYPRVQPVQFAMVQAPENVL